MANDYKATTNLPKTDFPMRGNLAKNEPTRLATWEHEDAYNQLREARAKGESFVLHDGPPYANGPIHLGHALNKISKDFVNRYYAMRGKKITFIPGWDCHGQPIEHKVEEQLGTKTFRALPKTKIRELCRACAVENIDLQKQGFRRLGVLADWDHAYLTLSNTHDATDIEIFKHIYDSGAIYRGKKPVHWCTQCQTALAEAEIEYHDIEGPSIFVAFKLDENTLLPAKTSLAVWTTTPWTLPANAGVSIQPEGTYVLLQEKDAFYVVLEELAASVAEVAGFSGTLAKGADGKTLRIPAEKLRGLTYTHPIFPAIHPPIIAADFVTTETGTGLVHTAPGHGADDYYAGQEFGLETVMPVDDSGHFYKGTSYGSGGPFSGELVWEANPRIIAFLKHQDTLIAEKTITHSYPHCWRCKNPVIFRATSQWFVSMDKTGLREETLNFVRNSISWYPKSSLKRIEAMLVNRPDWCISRQRTWGVPIPAFTCADCGEVLITDETLDATIKLFEEKGSDAWFSEEPKTYLGDLARCPACGSDHIEPGNDILDVWWDSGVSHTAVLQKRPDLTFPADMYLEGSDQHRGWFQASLLTSVGAWHKPPFKECVTLGFTLDGEGRKMSKSLGNVIDPNKVADTLGADIIRLWVASVDAMQDMPCNQEILQRVSEAYRRFRNTFRYLLGGLGPDYAFSSQSLAPEKLTAYDQAILAKATQVHKEVEKAYQSYRYNQVYRLLYDFVVSDLSNGYLNATKDRMYCDAPDALSRKSAVTTYYYLLEMLMHDLQPILAFTTDEVFSFAPAEMQGEARRAAELLWWESPLPEALVDQGLLRYEIIQAIRQAYTKAYEEGVTQEAYPDKTTQATRVTITLPKAELDVLSDFAGDLSEVLICSEAAIHKGESLNVCVEPARGKKCPRCWNYRELGKDGVCKRCEEALLSYSKKN